MAVIQRPPKEGGATTYQGKVAQGYTTILASEVDADLDAIYAAWNGGTDTVNIADNSITSAKIQSGAVGSRELQDGGIATVDIGNAQVTAAKLGPGAAASNLGNAGGDLSGTYPSPAVAKINAGTLPMNPRGLVAAYAAGTFDFSANDINSLGHDGSKPAWLLRLDYTNDQLEVFRAPAGSGSYTNLFTVNNTGKITAGATVRQHQFVQIIGGTWSTLDTAIDIMSVAITTAGGLVVVTCNHHLSYVQFATSGSCQVMLALLRDGSIIAQAARTIGVTSILPLPSLSHSDYQCPAGAHTYKLQVTIGSGTSANVMGTANYYGQLVVQEVG